MPRPQKENTLLQTAPKHGNEHFHWDEGQKLGWHQHPQIDPEWGRCSLTPVLQTEAKAQQGLPGALANEPDVSPALCHLSIDSCTYKEGQPPHWCNLPVCWAW